MRKRRGIRLSSLLALALALVVLGGMFVFFSGQGREAAPDRALKIAEALVKTVRTGMEQVPLPDSSPHPISTVAAAVVAPQPTVTKAPQIPINVSVGGLVHWPQAALADAEQAAVLKDALSPIRSAWQGDINLAYIDRLASSQQAAKGQWGQAFLTALKQSGIDGLWAGNDTIWDEGAQGLNDSYQALIKAGFTVPGMSSEGHRTTTMAVNGLKVGFVHAIESLSHTGQKKDKDKQATALSLMGIEDIKSRVRLASETHDLVILSLYAGPVNGRTVTQKLEKQLEEYAEAGADIVLAARPLIFQRPTVYRYQSADGSLHESLMVPSLGTLIGEKRDNINVLSSAVVHIRCFVTPGAKDLRFRDLAYTPTYNWRQREGKETLWQVLPSAATAPGGMNKVQTQQMQKALKVIESLFAQSLFKRQTP